MDKAGADRLLNNLKFGYQIKRPSLLIETRQHKESDEKDAAFEQ
jgi:hypothetical protein